jgi:DNA-binding NtrC family response regulator
MPGTLLIVDDNAAVARAYVRGLHRWQVGEVRIALNPEEAERMLATAQPPVFVICDCHLGDDQPAGTDLIPRWKAAFPQLAKAALVTGSTLPSDTAGIEGVFIKPAEMADIATFFGFPAR